jgi:hypothetical protein
LIDFEEIHRRCTAFHGGYTSEPLDNCRECNHSWKDHRHFHSEWEVQQQSETIVDDEAKQKFDAAYSQTDKIVLQQQQIKEAIQKFEKELQQRELYLGQLCLQFQGLALSGSFSSHIGAAIRMLKVRLATMKSSGSDPDSIKRMEERIESLSKRYDIVEKARRVGQSLFRIGRSSGVQGIGRSSEGNSGGLNINGRVGGATGPPGSRGRGLSRRWNPLKKLFASGG